MIGEGLGYYGPVLHKKPAPPKKKPCPCPCGCGCESSSGVCTDCGCVQQDVPGIPTNMGDTGLQYASILEGSPPTTADYGQGTNMLCSLIPVLCQLSSSTAGGRAQVAVIFDNDRVYFFTQNPGHPPTYTPQFDVDAKLVFDDFTNEFQFTATDGQSFWFNPEGTFLARQSGDDQMDATLDAHGRITMLSRTVGGVTDELIFQRDPASGRVMQITSQQAGVTPTYIRQAQYEYYGGGGPGDGYGNAGDLKTATVLALDSTGAFAPLFTTYYRYYLGGDAGFRHGMKYVVGPAAYQRMVEAGHVPATASNATVAKYADFYFTYDRASHRALSAAVQGGLLRYCYSYTDSPLGPSTSYSDWQLKTAEYRPDGSVRTTYSNYINQVLLVDLASSTASGAQHWVKFFQINGRGLVTLEAKPSAVLSYDDTHSDLDVSLATGGKALLLVTKYYTSTTAGPTMPGGVLDQVHQTFVQNGTGGPQVIQATYKYLIRSVGTGYWYPRAYEANYPTGHLSDPVETTNTFQWYADSTQAKLQSTAVPQVPTAQNGAGTTAEGGPQYYRNQYFDDLGNLLATQDERGYINTYHYDLPTGSRTRMVEDDNPPAVTGWSRPSGAPAAMRLTSNYTVDLLGRTTQALGPPHSIDLGGSGATQIRTATWTIYQDLIDQVWTAQGYQTVSGGSFTPVNPVSIEMTPTDALTRTSVQATRASTSGALQPTDSFPQLNWVRWSVDLFNIHSQQTASRVYTTIPTMGTGAPGTNYLQTDFGYDDMNRRNKSVTPAGTITRTVFDVRDNLMGVYVGTNDTGASDSDPTNGGTAPNNMLPVVLNVYDNGTGGGDNNLTQTTSKVDGNATNDRIANFQYDFRSNRTLTTGPLNFCKQVSYDNLDRPIQADRYNGSVATANLLSRNKTEYDDLGRVYRTVVYAVDPATGGVGHALTSNLWYDPAGNTLKDKPAGSSAWTKFTYDAVARQVWNYRGYTVGSENYAEAGTVTSSIVFEQTQTHYDHASSVVQTDSYQRFHIAATTGGNAPGVLGGPSDTYRPARVSFVVMYPDGIGRTVNTADYGTHGDASSLSCPPNCHARSDTVLVTSVIFNDRGEPFQTIDPAGTTNQTTLDNAARRTQFIQNYVFGGTGSDQNITTNWTYDNGGHVSGLHAINAATGTQVTSYSYGVTVSGGSTINSNDALHITTMPDGGTTVLQVNRQGEVILMTDANGTVHQYSRDQLARLTLDAVTHLPSGVDGAVLAIGLSYEIRSLLEKITSYAAASGPGGTVVNEVENVYNGFWQLQQQYQEHSGAVNTSTSLSVQYGYANGSANTIRPTSVTYPNANVLHFGYGSHGQMDDHLSRIDSIAEGSDTVATYNFLGLATPVIVTYPDPVVQYTLATGSGAGLYSNNLDRFGRVIDCLWQEDSGSSPAALVNLGYGYDRASNRKWRADNVSKSLSAPQYFDEFYGYDGVYRLAGLARGQLSGSPPTGVTGQTFGETWSLDTTGNWGGYTQQSSAGMDTLDQTRTANTVNEITGITNTIGSAWAQPGYDAAGNMTTMPQPNSLTDGYTGKFDAWNRLVKLTDSTTSDTVQKNQYDGRSFRIVKTAFSGGIAIETRDFYFSNSWRTLEERVSGTVDRQYVWGLRYIDDLVLRDRTTGGGTLNERFYALQDANWNVVAIFDSSTSSVKERFAFSAFGVVLPLNPDFTPYSGTTDYNWTVLYTGREQELTTGLLYFRRRYLLARAGVFVTRDPIRLKNSFSLYSFVNNKPTSSVDPTGLRGAAAYEKCLAEMVFSMAAHSVDRKAYRKFIDKQLDIEWQQPVFAKTDFTALKDILQNENPLLFTIAKIALGGNADAITLGRHIYTKDVLYAGDREKPCALNEKELLDAYLIGHELTHVVQQFERPLTAANPGQWFYALYLQEYGENLQLKMSNEEAYYQISYEREARAVQTALKQFLDKRTNRDLFNQLCCSGKMPGLNNEGLDAQLLSLQRTLTKLFNEALQVEEDADKALREKLNPPPVNPRPEDWE